jgi:DnaA regulatory inactivator Hda
VTQLTFDLGHRPALGAEDFLIAPSNAEAVAWLDRWPDWPAAALVVWGPEGSGKSHLAHVFAERSRALAVTPGELTIERVGALAASPAVMVDDAHEAAELPLFHLYNLVAERRASLLLTARAAPAQWPIRLADLRSRLVAAPAVALKPPDDALLGAVMLKLFADRQLAVAEDLVPFLLGQIERSFAAARRTVEALDQAALVAGRKITVPFARAQLRRGAAPEE